MKAHKYSKWRRLIHCLSDIVIINTLRIQLKICRLRQTDRHGGSERPRTTHANEDTMQVEAWGTAGQGRFRRQILRHWSIIGLSRYSQEPCMKDGACSYSRWHGAKQHSLALKATVFEWQTVYPNSYTVFRRITDIHRCFVAYTLYIYVTALSSFTQK